MTVSSEVSKAGPYTGNGVTVNFPFGFLILDQAHIRVVRTEAGIDTTLTTGFTVSGVGNPAGGSVTFSVAPTAAQKITILRDIPNVQETDLVNQGAYFAEVVEAALDLAAMRDQQLQEQVDRSLKIPVGQGTEDFSELLTAIAAVAAVDEEVAALAAVAGDIPDVAAIATEVQQVAQNVTDIRNFNDIYQIAATAPALRADGTALVAGDMYFDTTENKLKIWTGTVWQASTSSVNGIVQNYQYLATAGQTVFAAVYDIGFADVYLNGVRLKRTVDYTALNGTSITLTAGAALNDEIEIVCFGTFALADTLTKSQNLSDVPNRNTAGLIPVGSVHEFAMKFTPEGYLVANGAEHSRATYPDLFNYLCPVIGAATISIASPAVVTRNAHGLENGDRIRLLTTGALPTGLNTTTDYFVVNTTTNTFQLSLTAGGVAINTTGTQSGVHSVQYGPHGFGNGTTTFNVPQYCGVFRRGLDLGRGVDAGRVIGSEQLDQNKAHTHTITDPGHTHTTTAQRMVTGASNVGGSDRTLTSATVNSATTGITINSDGGTEARPRNAVTLVCIKF